jgi:hypothetical protein
VQRLYCLREQPRDRFSDTAVAPYADSNGRGPWLSRIRSFKPDETATCFSDCHPFELVIHSTPPGQWLDYKTPGIPRTANGKPDLAAPAPRAAHGKPDLSGIYQAASARQFQDITAGLKKEEFPIQPWAAALAKRREEENRKDDPYSHCLPPGVPRINVANHPFKILQLPGQ